jgi:hypothetical protein
LSAAAGERESRDTVSGLSDANEADTLRRVDALIELLPASDEPYWVAVDVMGAASGALVTSLTASHHYRIWAGLTDRYELKPDERPETVAEMLQAASEWLTVKDDAGARRSYFDKWL